jgi:hypothetical protein
MSKGRARDGAVVVIRGTSGANPCTIITTIGMRRRVVRGNQQQLPVMIFVIDKAAATEPKSAVVAEVADVRRRQAGSKWSQLKRHPQVLISGWGSGSRGKKMRRKKCNVLLSKFYFHFCN